MNMEAVRMPEQDILSAVMRRQIIRHADPYLSLDQKANPLLRCGEAVQGLVRTYRGEVKTLLSTLSRGKISISDFSAAIDELLSKIRGSDTVDMSAFSEIEASVFCIREHIDTVCALARHFIASPPENDRNLGWPDAELLRQVEAARAQVASKAASQQVVAPAAVSAPVMAAPAETAPQKRLIRIDHSDGPLKDDARYWPFVESFLSKKRISDARCPRMAAVYRILSELSLGGSLSRPELQGKIGANYSINAMTRLLGDLRQNGLVLYERDRPETPGCYVKVIGRRSQDKTPGEYPKGYYYCYGLALVVEETPV